MGIKLKLQDVSNDTVFFKNTAIFTYITGIQDRLNDTDLEGGNNNSEIIYLLSQFNELVDSFRDLALTETQQSKLEKLFRRFDFYLSYNTEFLDPDALAQGVISVDEKIQLNNLLHDLEIILTPPAFTPAAISELEEKASQRLEEVAQIMANAQENFTALKQQGQILGQQLATQQTQWDNFKTQASAQQEALFAEKEQKLQENLDATLAYISQMKHQIEADVTGLRQMIGTQKADHLYIEYQQTAQKEEKQAHFWRRFTLSFIAFAAIWLIGSLTFPLWAGAIAGAEADLWIKQSESTPWLIRSLSVTAIFLVGAFYSAQQSTKHRHAYNSYRERADQQQQK